MPRDPFDARCSSKSVQVPCEDENALIWTVSTGLIRYIIYQRGIPSCSFHNPELYLGITRDTWSSCYVCGTLTAVYCTRASLGSEDRFPRSTCQACVYEYSNFRRKLEQGQPSAASRAREIHGASSVPSLNGDERDYVEWS